MADQLSTILPIAAIMLSICSLLVSLSNRRTARRALSISEAQEARQQASLTVRIQELVAWTADDSERFAGTRVLITNNSDREGSITRIALASHLKPAAGSGYIREHQPLPDVRHDSMTHDTLAVPINVPANGSTAGWLTFRVTNPTGHLIDNYELIVEDSRGPIITTSAWPLRELA